MATNNKKRMTRTIIWVVVGLLALIIIGLTLTKSHKPGNKYEIISPTKNDSVIQNTVLTGSIEPRDEILVKPKMSGIISELMHLPGDQVQEGELIARIRMVPDVATVQNAASRVESARVALQQAKNIYDRDKELFDQHILAKEKFEQSTAEYDRAKIDLSSAIEQLDLASKGSSASTARENNTLVRATVSGTILEQPVKVGASVIQSNNFNDGTTIVSIADLNDLLFIGDVNESDVNKVKPGANVIIRVGAIRNRTFPAVVEYVSPKGIEKSGTILFEVKAALSRENLEGLKAGFSSNAEIELDRRTGVMTIPEGAVTYKGTKAYVYITEGGNETKDFKEKEVKLGLSDGLKVEVISGLTGNEKLRGNQLGAKKE